MKTFYRKVSQLPSDEQVIKQLTKDELVSNIINILGIHEAQNEPTQKVTYTNEYVERLHNIIEEQDNFIVKYQNDIKFLNEDIQESDEAIEELEWETMEQKKIIKRLEEKLNGYVILLPLV